MTKTSSTTTVRTPIKFFLLRHFPFLRFTHCVLRRATIQSCHLSSSVPIAVLNSTTDYAVYGCASVDMCLIFLANFRHDLINSSWALALLSLSLCHFSVSLSPSFSLLNSVPQIKCILRLFLRTRNGSLCLSLYQGLADRWMNFSVLMCISIAARRRISQPSVRVIYFKHRCYNNNNNKYTTALLWTHMCG